MSIALRSSSSLRLTGRLCLPALALLAACSSPHTVGQERMDTLSWQIESTANHLQVCKQQYQEALAAHDMLVANADRDPTSNYKRYARIVDDCVAEQQKLAVAATQLETSKSAYLTGWQADNSNITDGELRERGEQRRESARARLDQVQALLDELQASQQPLLALMRDHAIYLSNELNPDAAASLAPEGDTLRQAAGKLFGTLEQAAVELRATARTLEITPES